MAITEELIQLEHRAWQALTTSGDAAAAFYEEVLADDVLVLMPGGFVIDDREAVIESMGGAPWDDFEISDERVLELSQNVALLTYRATAIRAGNEYTALFNSTFVRDDGAWRMAIHQQTPV